MNLDILGSLLTADSNFFLKARLMLSSANLIILA